MGAALYSIGIPKDSILAYEIALKSNKFLIVAQGTAAEAGQAHDILQGAGSVKTDLHRGGQHNDNDAEKQETHVSLCRDIVTIL